MTAETVEQAAPETEAPIPAPDKVALKQQKKADGVARKKILAPVNGALALASLVIVIASVCSVVPFILIVEACRELLSAPVDTDRVWWLVISAVVVLIVRGLLEAGALVRTHLLDASFQHTLRQQLAAKLTRVPLGWFTDRSSGEVKRFLQDDVEALHYLIAHARLDFVGAVTVQVVALVYLFTVDWRLTLVLLIPLFLYTRALAAMMGEGHRERFAVFAGAERKIEESTIEFVDGIQVVRAFGQARKAHNTFQDAVDKTAAGLLAWKTPMTRLQAAAEILLTPLFMMLVVVVAGLGFVGLDWIEPVDILPFLLVGIGLGSALLGIGYNGQALREGAAAALRLHELQQTPELVAPTSGGSGLDADTKAGLPVRFEDVSFGYRKDRTVLRDIDIELAPGTITALVGPSGSGKSTLARLLPRFYDVTAGRITIGGKDLREFSTEELYRTVGFVLQDVQMIRGTIRENILLARPDADEATVERAARAAQIHERIVALPRGYDSEIGVDAILSGGEAQRLSIARTLLADTPVLVLDEATAFADPESEAAVQDALAVLVADRTVLVIAHRLHTITGVDRILVLENGIVVENGDHPTLVRAGGLYQRLFETNEASMNEIQLVEGETR
ncbi:ATP-binding cassette subfamily B protein/ATP-binding cassette subfamily B protein IrtA [Nocardia transvalensis]|uniref:ATP-binding cassette subfamily B protein/ATP-binding cassette subfamily B protein IrtA n=1 Tax=Nocardia transvalensis TaxID=37333 RepID=A0A7W9PBE7_9NOCA|nr:ABC transporter ATP-binding protein [Nocardia transvalensis]MBB5912920.1 ATP-binding cassette subfamily B protein/ATP-binding cassette subfamily B protein IrtA [Nocardia transvalensis]